MNYTSTNRLAPKLPFLLVLIISLFFCSYNFFWKQEALKVYPLFFDQALYIYKGVIYTQALKEDGIGEFLRAFLTLDPARAPLYSLSMLPLFLVDGYSPGVAYLVTLGYLLLFVGAVYGLGNTLGGPGVGLWSVVILGGAASFINFSREYMLEFPLAALFAFTLLGLIKSRNFTSFRWSALAGLGAGLCLMMKTMAVGFLAGPLLYVFYKFWRTPEKKSKIPALAAMGALFLLVTGPFYGRNFKEIFHYIFFFGFGPGASRWTLGQGFWSFANFIYYPSALLQYFYSLPLFLLLLALVIYRLRPQERPWSWGESQEAQEGFKLLGVALLCGYLLLTVSSIKSGHRFAMPLFGPLAVVTAHFLGDTRKKIIKNLVLILTAIMVTINYASLTVQPFTFKKPINFLSYQVFPLPSYFEETCSLFYQDPNIKRDAQGRPLMRPENWGFPVLVRALEEERKREGFEQIRVHGFAAHPILNINSLGYYAALQGAKIVLRDGSEGKDALTAAQSRYIRYLLLKEGGEQYAAAEKVDKLAQELRRQPQEYLCLAQVLLPDGSLAVIYKKAAWRRLPSLPKVKVVPEVEIKKSLTLAGVDVRGEEVLQLFLYWRGEPRSLKGVKGKLRLISYQDKEGFIPIEFLQGFSIPEGQGAYGEEYFPLRWRSQVAGKQAELTLFLEGEGIERQIKIDLGKVKIPPRSW